MTIKSQTIYYSKKYCQIFVYLPLHYYLAPCTKNNIQHNNTYLSRRFLKALVDSFVARMGAAAASSTNAEVNLTNGVEGSSGTTSLQNESASVALRYEKWEMRYKKKGQKLLESLVKFEFKFLAQSKSQSSNILLK